ncbi:hypothetical protein FN846DRAFT_937685 [Sphaerosporella brunnea]|uniref:Uncharacterized protein n=1 Tax=Sphaerosporella brunnea TaxID=1250544 RepID=A0A5J5F3Q5_9PEZI|nr:hypothetical protein FN846DRAFT_937685 [Sphaerosporella brunnea]
MLFRCMAVTAATPQGSCCWLLRGKKKKNESPGLRGLISRSKAGGRAGRDTSTSTYILPGQARNTNTLAREGCYH